MQEQVMRADDVGAGDARAGDAGAGDDAGVGDAGTGDDAGAGDAGVGNAGAGHYKECYCEEMSNDWITSKARGEGLDFTELYPKDAL